MSTSALTPAERWKLLIDEQNRLGLTARAFAQLRGVNVYTLVSWRSRLRRRDDPPAAFIELVPARDAEAPVQIRPDGLSVTIEVHPGVDLAWLRAVGFGAGDR